MLYSTDMYRIFKNLTGIEVNQDTLAHIVNQEAELEYQYQRSQGHRMRRLTAQKEALQRVVNWANSANEYLIPCTWESIADFAGSHRKATVWAVALGKVKYTQTTKG